MNPIRPAILTLTALACASAQAQPGPSLDQLRESLVPYASDADVVTLPTGQKVGFTCMGQGSPTVILIPGMGDFGAMTWGNVHPQMAQTTKVCTWDRPGWGLSDGAEGKQTVATTAATLEAALATGKIAGPYVLVGHSIGGLEALLLGDRLREQVAGMVLVDPSVPDQHSLLQREAPALAAEAAAPHPAVDGFRKCAADIRSGAARAGGSDPNNCFGFPPFFPPELSAAFGAQVSNPINYETMASFMENAEESFRAAINSTRDYRDMPLIVLTATTMGPAPPGRSPEALQQAALWQDVFSRAHDDLAKLSTRGVNARVPGAHHYIQSSKPQVVIDAVEAVVAEARAGKL